MLSDAPNMRRCRPFVLDWLVISFLWLTCFKIKTLANQDRSCRTIHLLPVQSGRYLEGHVFMNLTVGKDACEHWCLMENKCVSVNIASEKSPSRVICELSDSDHCQHQEDLKPRQGWTYRGAKNHCCYNPCRNNGKCLLGYTDKKYLCECPPGFQGENCENVNSSIIDSVILSPELLPDFHRMVESVAGRNGQWVLCYRGSIHGWSAQTFHRRCDKKINTVTLVKRLSYVFGGFTDIAWDSVHEYGSTTNAFIFSLRNFEGLSPFKVMVTNPSQAIYKNPSFGPAFGGGHDILLDLNTARTSRQSYTNLGNSYVPTGVEVLSTVLTGVPHFSPSEVEVFFLHNTNTSRP
ncbi:uncharacterized protein [Montipora capricornis]|uniref:uncharacterized protein n=1 Tax=Montipora capricornis TaxID=246305 RepID=UPI0035F214E4